MLEGLGDSSEDIVLGTEGARDKREGTAEDKDGVIEEVVVDEVVLVEFNGAVYAEVEESGGKKDEQGVVRCDKGKEEGCEEDEDDIGEEEPPFAVVGGVPCGDVTDEGAEAAGVCGGFEPAGEPDEDGEDDPEVEIEEEDPPQRVRVVVFLPRDVESVSAQKEVHGDTEAEL